MPDVLPASRAQELAETLGGSLEDRFLSAAGVRIRGSLDIRQVVLDELAIDGLAASGPVVVSGCRFGTLRIKDLVVREGIIVEDCEIGSLEIRGASRSTISVLRSGLRRCVLHECGTLVVDTTTVTEVAAISDPHSCVEMARSAVGSMRFSADGPADLTEVHISSLTVRDRLDVVGLDGATFSLNDVAATRVLLRSLRFDDVQLRDVSIERDLGVQALSGRGRAPKLELGGVVGSASLVVADPRGAELSVRGATIRGDLTVGGPADVHLDGSSAVEGVLRSSQGARGARIKVAPGANVRAVQPPATPVRSAKMARKAADELLGGAGVTELAILHDSLQDRPDEQDMAYFALRQAEQDSASGFRKRTMWLRGQLFGWGVTFSHPLRTFTAAVLATAAAIFVLNPANSSGTLARVADALTSSLGLWFNVGTGMPDGLDGPGWALAAVGCTALGIALITVLTGVAIRRLTR